MASRAAAIFFSFFLTFFLFGRKILFIFGDSFFFAKMKKKVPSQPSFSHPAAPPETDLFLVWPGVST